MFHLSRAGWLRWYDKAPATRLRPGGKSPIALRVSFDDGSAFDLTEHAGRPVSTLSGGVPFCASAFASAIEKHDECAAAMSSSGVVTDVEPSLRAFQLTASGPWFELSRATSPEPSVPGVKGRSIV